MSDEQLEKLSDTYDWLSCLLLYFLESTYLPVEERDDLKTIQRFVSVQTFDKKAIQTTIDQAKEILALKEFPAEWVMLTANKYPFNKGHETTPEDYRNWVEWMVKTLEEAKKIGKL